LRDFFMSFVFKYIHTSEHMVLRFNQHFRNLTFLLQMTAYLTGNIELDDNLHFTVFNFCFALFHIII